MKPFIYSVQLGQNFSRITYNESYGDLFAYFSKEERGEFDGEVSEMVRATTA
jgi:hypothetical protein